MSLTPEEATQRALEGFRRVPPVDLTHKNPLKKPLTEEETAVSQTLDPEALKQRQEQVAFKQSLEEGQQIREAERLKQVTHPPETPVQKIGRLSREETR